MVRSKCGYRVVYSGRQYKKLRKSNPDLKKEVFIEINESWPISCLFHDDINDRGVKIYLVYGDGTEQRIKAHERYFHNIFAIIKSLIKYKGMYLKLLFARKGKNR